MAEYDDSEPSDLDEEELFARLKAWFKEDRDASNDWRVEAQEDFAFSAGHQWDEADAQVLRDQLRPCVTFDQTGPVIDNVSGMEVNNRQEVRYIPRTEGDEQVNEVLSGAAQFVRDGCDAEDEESDAFRDMLICGMGWTETRLDYDVNPDGNVLIERVDPLEMTYDTRASRANLDDGTRLFRVKEISYAEAKAMFKDAEAEDLHAAWASGGDEAQNPIRDNLQDRYKEGDAAKIDNRKKCRVVEAQWYEMGDYHRVMDPFEGGIKDLTPDEFKELEDKLSQIEGAPELQSVKLQKRIYKRAFLGAKLLETGDSPCPTHFTYRAMTGKRDRNKNQWYGLMRGMKDPQRWANKFLSTIQHNVSTQGKGIIAERDAFDNPQQAETDWARPDKIVWTKAGAVAGGKIMPKPQGQFPNGVEKLFEIALMAIRNSTGVNTEMMGAADREQAGVLEYQRKQSAMTILATMFDSLRRYRKEQGRVLLYFITKYLSDGRLIRIVGEQGAQYVKLAKQPETIEYDVIVDEAPTSPNQKEATWAILGSLMPTLMKLPLPPQIWVEIIKQSPLPTSFATKIEGILEQQQQQPPPPDPELVKAQAQIQAAQQKAQADQQIKAQELQFEMQIETARFQLEKQKAENEMQIAVTKANNELQVARQKAALEMQVRQETAAQEMAAQRDQQQFDAGLQERTTDANIQNQTTIANAKAKQAARPKPKAKEAK